MKHVTEALREAMATWPSEERVCFGVNCQAHKTCQRYAAVETQPEAERIGRCEGKSLYIPIKEQA